MFRSPSIYRAEILLNSLFADPSLAGELLVRLPADSSGDGALAGIGMDSDTFAAFYERAARPLWAYLARVSADPALADDLMQESFVRFLCAAHPEPADGEVAARRYLFRIATNLLRDHWRHPPASSIEELPEDLFAHPDRSAQSDAEALLGHALAQLRPRDRQILWLAHAEGYSHREIAQITGLGSTSIRLLLFRARRKIARILQDETSPAQRSLPAIQSEAHSATTPHSPIPTSQDLRSRP
jgi:RNA polymerase sigma-70 factor (ECF subfamily)